MSHFAGTATDMNDFLSKIRTNALAEGWFDCVYVPNEVWIAKGPGDGSDEVYIEIRLFYSVATQTWCFGLAGAMGYRNGTKTLLNFFNPVGYTYVSLWDHSIGYNLCITGRRILFMAKVSTKYAIGHVGLLSPFGTSEQYPYPMFIGGTKKDQASWTGDSNLSFFHDSEEGRKASALLVPDGSSRGDNTISNDSESQEIVLSPWGDSWDFKDKIAQTIGDQSILFPAMVHYNSSNQMGFIRQCAGQIDGLAWVSGFNQSPENEISIGGGDTYKVFPSYDSTERTAWCALKLA